MNQLPGMASRGDVAYKVSCKELKVVTCSNSSAFTRSPAMWNDIVGDKGGSCKEAIAIIWQGKMKTVAWTLE